MFTPDPFVTERRTSLIAAAQRVEAEAGADNVALVDPALVTEIMRAVAEDVGSALDARLADGVETTEQLVDALLDGALTAQRPWNDALRLVAVSVERITDFVVWEGILAPWVDTVERTLVEAQGRGLIHPEVDPRSTAMIMRDTMQRSARYGLAHGRESYLEQVTRLLVAALRPAE